MRSKRKAIIEASLDAFFTGSVTLSWGRIFALRNISQSPNFRPVKRPEDDTSREMGDGYALLTVGITFALTLTGCVLLGFWADRRLGTTPLLTVAGTLLGMALGGFWMYQRVRRQSKPGP